MLKYSFCALSQVVLHWWLQIISTVEFAVNPFVCHIIWFWVDGLCCYYSIGHSFSHLQDRMTILWLLKHLHCSTVAVNCSV
jgi:hypothetical protein